MNRKSALAGLAVVVCTFGHAADSLTLAVRGAMGQRGGTLRFIVPEGGFAATPIARMNPVGSAPFAWASEWNGMTSATQWTFVMGY